MSLLDNPPHEVFVTPVIRERDRYGEAAYRKKDRVGPIRCAVQPYSSGQNNVTGVKIEKYGTQVKSGYTVFARQWPGGPASIIEWRGELFQQDGEAQEFTMGGVTDHVELVMIKQEVEMF